jgi:hypothetical protein
MLDSTLQRWAVPARMSTAAALAALGLMLFLALALASAPRADAVQFCNASSYHAYTPYEACNHVAELHSVRPRGRSEGEREEQH